MTSTAALEPYSDNGSINSEYLSCMVRSLSNMIGAFHQPTEWYVDDAEAFQSSVTARLEQLAEANSGKTVETNEVRKIMKGRQSTPTDLELKGFLHYRCRTENSGLHNHIQQFRLWMRDDFACQTPYLSTGLKPTEHALVRESWLTPSDLRSD